MFLGRILRKKRRLSLQTLPTAPKTRKLLKGMWRPSRHNVRGQARNWYESVFRSHAAWCGCGDFVTHLSDLANDFGRPGPAGAPEPPPPPVRPLPALPAPPNTPSDRAAWPSGGGAAAGDDRGDRGAGGGFAELADEDLLDAAADLAAE